MQRLQRVAIGLTVWTLTFAVAAQQPIIYPARGQSAQQQNNDTAQCQLWATQTTGVDPVAIAQQGANQPPPQQQQGGMLRGAAGGAALGAMGGAIAGDAGKGAAIGAVVGTAAGGIRQRRRNEAAAGQQQANNQQASQQMATFSRAVAACMTGRGYTVQ
jgi:Glycine zipper